MEDGKEEREKVLEMLKSVPKEVMEGEELGYPLREQATIEMRLDDREHKVSISLLLRRDFVRFVEPLLDFSQLVFNIHEKHSAGL
jgi:hypothetical protein